METSLFDWIEPAASDPQHPEPLYCSTLVHPAGRLLLVATPRGVCNVRFCDDPQQALRQLQQERAGRMGQWHTTPLLEQAALHLLHPHCVRQPLPVEVRGTAFQRRVWQALATIPQGHTLTYQALAQRIGAPTAARAVGQAVGANPLAILLPCHRVLPASGGIGHYHWGVLYKQRLLQLEHALP